MHLAAWFRGCSAKSNGHAGLIGYKREKFGFQRENGNLSGEKKE